MQKDKNITNPKTERGHYMNRTKPTFDFIQMASRKVERRTISLSLTTEAAAKSEWGERGSCPQTNSTQSCSNADSTGADGCDGGESIQDRY